MSTSTTTITAAELGEEHVGRHVDLGPDRPFAVGLLERIEPTDGPHRRLTIRHGRFGRQFPVTAFVRPDCPVSLS